MEEGVTKNKSQSSSIHFMAGGLSGASATLLSQPLDVIKTRMIGAHNNSAIQTARSIVFNNNSNNNTTANGSNIIKLWRGTAPALARIIPAGMTYFGSVHLMKKFFQNNTMISSDPNVTNFVIGATARSIATALTCPLMVVKTKFEFMEQSTSMMNVIKQLGQNRSLFSGLIPSIVRDVPYSGTFLLLYESSKKELNLYVSNPVAISLLSATIAGTLATIITQPFDVARTHIQINAAVVTERSGVTRTMKNVVGTEGMIGLLRGVCPRIVKRSLSSAISWTVYEAIVRLHENNRDTTTTTASEQLITSRVEKDS